MTSIYKRYSEVSDLIKKLEQEKEALSKQILEEMDTFWTTEQVQDGHKFMVVERTTFWCSKSVEEIEAIDPNAIEKKVNTKYLQSIRDLHQYLEPKTSTFIKVSELKWDNQSE